jgi:PAS domain S-box-containing protein
MNRDEGRAEPRPEQEATPGRREQGRAEGARADAPLLRRLERSQARYKALVQASSNVVWVRDPELRFIERSPDWERFTGQRFEQYQGYGWLNAVHPGDRANVQAAVAQTLSDGATVYQGRLRLWRAGSDGSPGSYRHCEVTAAAVRDESGAVLEWVGMVRDRTEQHESEDLRLRQTQELARSNRDLEDFAYIAAHDLKEPLRGIRLIVSFLEEDGRGKVDEDAARRMAQLQELCARMQGLLDSLLESAKVSSAALVIEDVELTRPAAEGLQLVGARAQEPGVEVRIDDSLLGVRVCGDAQRLAQVFSNLISNGIKYNESSPRVVEVRVEPTPAGEPPGMVTVCVSDNGIGVPADKHEAVFRMFRRLHPRECYGGGAGAGLSIVKKIVERHGGRVWLESAGPGQGASVRFTLPSMDLCEGLDT